MNRIAAPMIGRMVTVPLLSMLVIPAAHLLMKRQRALRVRQFKVQFFSPIQCEPFDIHALKGGTGPQVEERADISYWETNIARIRDKPQSVKVRAGVISTS